MEKLKNIINPGSKRDDEVMYGSGQSDDPVHSGNLNTSGPGSHFDKSRTGGHDPLASSTNPESGAAELGVGNTSYSSATTSSTNPASGSQYDKGVTGHGTHGLSEPYASRMPGGFDNDDDAATTASVRSGVPGQATQTGSNMKNTHDPSFNNKSLPHEPASAGSGLIGSGYGASKEESLTGSKYPDRSIGSSNPADAPKGPSHPERDAALGAGALGAGTTAAQHHGQQGNLPREDYAPEVGRSFPLGGSSNASSGSHYPHGQTGTHPSGDYTGSTTAGPHSSNLANKADPRVDSDLDGSRTAGSAGYGLGTGATPSSANQGSLQRDTSLMSSTGNATGGPVSNMGSHGPESWEHNHQKHGHTYEGDPCGPGEATATGAPLVPGPHATMTANLLDPKVSGVPGSTESLTGQGHPKEGAALASGAGAANLGAYEGSHGNLGSTSGSTTGRELDPTTGQSSTNAGPHKSSLLNKLDPRVDSDLSKQQGRFESGVDSSAVGASGPHISQETGPSHGNLNEAAALGGVGATGAIAYEGHKHHHDPQRIGTAAGHSLSDPNSSYAADPRVDNSRAIQGNTSDTTGQARDNHLGRDAALGAGAGGLAHEAHKHHGQPTQSSAYPSTSGTSTYDGTRDTIGHDTAGSQIAGSSQQPATTKEHHIGRDAALGAGAGGLLYEADKHHGSDHPGLASTPQDQLAGSGHQPQSSLQTPAHRGHGKSEATAAGLGAGTLGSHEYAGRDPYIQDSQDTGRHAHKKEEAAIAGGVAAAGLAHEHSKKEEKAYEKELAKEHKQHDKAVAKEEKAIAKDEKAHQQGEKKHGGLLGFLHRDKHDQGAKDQHATENITHNRAGDEELAPSAGTSSSTDPLAGESGTRSGVYDTPVEGSGSGIGSGITTRDAYGTTEGHNKLHKDPPAKVLQARGADYQGHGNVS